MNEVKIADKEKYLRLRYPFTNIPQLTDRRVCLHCGREFIVGDYKIMKDEKGREHICCPYAPACDGTILDWFKM